MCITSSSSSFGLLLCMCIICVYNVYNKNTASVLMIQWKTFALALSFLTYRTQMTIQPNKYNNSNTYNDKCGTCWCINCSVSWLPVERSCYWDGWCVIWCSGIILWMEVARTEHEQGGVHGNKWCRCFEVLVNPVKWFFLQSLQSFEFTVICSPEQSGCQTTLWYTLSEHSQWCSNKVHKSLGTLIKTLETLQKVQSVVLSWGCDWCWVTKQGCLWCVCQDIWNYQQFQQMTHWWGVIFSDLFEVNNEFFCLYWHLGGGSNSGTMRLDPPLPAYTPSHHWRFLAQSL